MPTTPIDLFNHVNLNIKGQVKWNTQIPDDEYGLYVVALTDKADKLICNKIIQFDETAIENWFSTISSKGKKLLVDKVPASKESLKNRLNGFWLPDETIIYIGKAGKQTLNKRINQYYETKLGSKRPHAGGHWSNVLKNLNELTVFYADCSKRHIDQTEELMISYFQDNVSSNTRQTLHDKINCFPFANKEINKKKRKMHGLNNLIVDCGSHWRKT